MFECSASTRSWTMLAPSKCMLWHASKGFCWDGYVELRLENRQNVIGNCCPTSSWSLFSYDIFWEKRTFYLMIFLTLGSFLVVNIFLYHHARPPELTVYGPSGNQCYLLGKISWYHRYRLEILLLYAMIYSAIKYSIFRSFSNRKSCFQQL